MADKTIEIETKGVTKAADELREVADASDQATDSLKKGEGQTKGNETSVAALTKKLAALGIAYSTIKAGVVNTTKQFAQQQATLGRLERSYGFATQRGESYSSVLKSLRERSTDLGVSFEAQVDGLSQLIDQTGSVTTAQSDLALAVDIAAQENLDLAASVEILRKVRNGEVEEVKNLDGINKDLAESLNKNASAGRRAQETIALLTDTYFGAADETRGLENDLDALSTASDRTQAAIGRIVVALGSKAGGLVGGLLETTGILSKEEQTLENVVTSFENLADAVERIETDQILELAAALGFTIASGGAGTPVLVAAVKDVTDELKEAKKAADELADARKEAGGASALSPRAQSAANRASFKGETGATGVERSPEELAAEEKRRQAELERLRDEAERREQARFDATQARRTAQIELLQRLKQEESDLADKRAIFANDVVNAEREAAEERMRIAEDQLQFQRKLDANARSQVKGEEQRAKRITDANKKKRAATVGDAEAIANAATGITDTIVQNEAARAAIQAAVQVGLGFAKAAIPDPVGATLHFAAAAQLTAAAAMGGKGGGATSKRGGGSARLGGSDRREAGSRLAKDGSKFDTREDSKGSRGGASDGRSDMMLLGEKARGRSGRDRGLTVIFDSTFPPGPEIRRALREAQLLDAESDA